MMCAKDFHPGMHKAKSQMVLSSFPVQFSSDYRVFAWLALRFMKTAMTALDSCAPLVTEKCLHMSG